MLLIVQGKSLELAILCRYGIEIAKGLLDLHSLGLLVLNLKPSNLLLNEHNHLVHGDFGIPYLLLGISLSDSSMALRLGTPKYMAPEQWEPEVRGPLSFETDVWGFGCCMVEMLSGIQPWFGKSVEEVYHSVVIKKEKPQIPSGLPPAVENVISGCFEYDFRNRPLIADILQEFKRYFFFLTSFCCPLYVYARNSFMTNSYLKKKNESFMTNSDLFCSI